MVVVRIRAEIAKSRQRNSMLQSLSDSVQVDLCSACGMDSVGSGVEV